MEYSNSLQIITASVMLYWRRRQQKQMNLLRESSMQQIRCSELKLSTCTILVTKICLFSLRYDSHSVCHSSQRDASAGMGQAVKLHYLVVFGKSPITPQFGMCRLRPVLSSRSEKSRHFSDTLVLESFVYSRALIIHLEVRQAVRLVTICRTFVARVPGLESGERVPDDCHSTGTNQQADRS